MYCIFELKFSFWQGLLTDRAFHVLRVVADEQIFRRIAMPLGMKNTSAMFQRIKNSVMSRLENCAVFIDDIIEFTEYWDHHLQGLQWLLSWLMEVRLVSNLKKCDFVCIQVHYLGYVVRYGVVFCPMPRWRQLRNLNGLKLNVNFDDSWVVLYNIEDSWKALLKSLPFDSVVEKKIKYARSNEWESSIESAKDISCNYLVAAKYDFGKPFSLALLSEM